MLRLSVMQISVLPTALGDVLDDPPGAEAPGY